MIRVRMDGEEHQLSYEQFIRAIQEGRVRADTPVWSEVLTSGVWKPAGELQFFRSWAPRQTTSPPRFEPSTPPSEPPSPQPPPPLPPPPGLPPPPAPPPPPGVPPSPPGPPPPPPPPSVPSGPPEPGPWVPFGQAAPGAPGHPASFSWPPAPAGEPIPWEQMERIGFSAGFTRTIGLAFQRVDEFADRIALTRVLLPPLVFALLITAVTALFEAIYSVGAMRMFGQVFEEFERQMPRFFGPDGFPSERDMLLSHGMRVMFYPVMAFIWAGVVHLGLRIFGRPAQAFAVTFRIVNYAMAPLILTVIPFCGNIVGWLWVLFLTIRSLARVQRVGGAAAFAAVILPMIAVCFWMVVANVGAMVRALTQFGGSF